MTMGEDALSFLRIILLFTTLVIAIFQVLILYFIYKIYSLTKEMLSQNKNKNK